MSDWIVAAFLVMVEKIRYGFQVVQNGSRLNVLLARHLYFHPGPVNGNLVLVDHDMLLHS